MKKVIFVLFIAISISTSLFSQKKLSFGLYLGSSITSLSGVDELAAQMSDTLSQTVGKEFPVSKASRSFLFNGGGFVSYSLTDLLSLKGGMEYAPKGVKFNGECYLSTSFDMTSEVLVMETRLKVAYIEFPISIQLSAKSKTKPDKAYFYANIGISPAIKAFSKIDVSFQLVERGFDNDGTTEKTLNTVYSENTLEGIKGFDLGMFGSIGVSNKSVFLDLKYNHGLTNINENTNSGLNNKNNMIALSLGVKF